MLLARRLIAAFVGLLAVGSVAVATASAALPEFQNKAFMSSVLTDGEAAQLKAQGGATMNCKTSAVTGEVITAKSKTLKEVTLELHECEAEGVKCTSAGAAEGTIVSEKLEGEIGYLATHSELGAKFVALALFPTAGRVGQVIAKYKCVENIEYKGCVVGELSEANATVQFYSLLFEETGGVQKYLKFEPVKGTNEPCEAKIKIGGNAEEKVGFQTLITPVVRGCRDTEKINTE
jgi:hypothetical protein